MKKLSEGEGRKSKYLQFMEMIEVGELLLPTHFLN